jgi:hypothetical protein
MERVKGKPGVWAPSVWISGLVTGKVVDLLGPLISFACDMRGMDHISFKDPLHSIIL